MAKMLFYICFTFFFLFGIRVYYFYYDIEPLILRLFLLVYDISKYYFNEKIIRNNINWADKRHGKLGK